MTTAPSIRAMHPDDYDAVLSTWRQCEGIGLTPSDTREAINAFLSRNPGLSLVAWHDNRIVGAVLCGHDGRRGYLYHLAVLPEYREHGIGRAIVNDCVSRLAACGIQKVTIFVYGHNDVGQRFWRRIGWKDRPDLVVLQTLTPAALA